MFSDEHFMQRCIDLALLGKGQTAPNPMVGAVLVHEGKIISEGYHKFYGGPHAEVEALSNVADAAVLSNSTLFVSLEPCSHFGKTPPCANLIVQKGIRKVVIGSRDPFPKVSGSGIEFLKAHGIEVREGVLENDCRDLNRRFFCQHEKKRPYIVLKWAQSTDGFIAPAQQNDAKLEINSNSDQNQQVHWISCPESRTLVHQWRSEEQAILVGKNTVIKDNPSLTVREVSGKNPIRIVIDPNCELQDKYEVFSGKVPTLILNKIKSEIHGSIQYLQSDLSIPALCNSLYRQGIQSVLVEGGANTLNRFIEANCWDEARVITGKEKLAAGIKAPLIPQPFSSNEAHFVDQISYYLNV